MINGPIDALMREHPQHEKMLRDALAFLDKYEPGWKLSQPIDRLKYLKQLLRSAHGSSTERSHRDE